MLLGQSQMAFCWKDYHSPEEHSVLKYRMLTYPSKSFILSILCLERMEQTHSPALFQHWPEDPRIIGCYLVIHRLKLGLWWMLKIPLSVVSMLHYKLCCLKPHPQELFQGSSVVYLLPKDTLQLLALVTMCYRLAGCCSGSALLERVHPNPRLSDSCALFFINVSSQLLT